MQDFFLAFGFDIARFALMAGAMVFGWYNILMMLDSISCYLFGRFHVVSYSNFHYSINQKEIIPRKIACRLAFNAFLSLVAFNICYSLIYKYPSLLMYQLRLQGDQ